MHPLLGLLSLPGLSQNHTFSVSALKAGTAGTQPLTLDPALPGLLSPAGSDYNSLLHAADTLAY